MPFFVIKLLLTVHCSDIKGSTFSSMDTSVCSTLILIVENVEAIVCTKRAASTLNVS